MNGAKVLYVKVMEVDDGFSVRTVVSVCDAELLGKVFKEGNKVLAVNEEFFGGDPMDPDEVVEYLRRAYTAMIVGEEAVKVALKSGIIHPDAVLRISGVPYAQIVRS